MKEDAIYLRHIMECIRRIEENISAGRDQFFASHTLQDAVLRNLQTMSESTQRLSPSLKARHPEVEWQRLAAFRNVVVHGYLGIDLEQIWGITEQNVPILKQQAAAMLAEVLRESDADAPGG